MNNIIIDSVPNKTIFKIFNLGNFQIKNPNSQSFKILFDFLLHLFLSIFLLRHKFNVTKNNN